MTKPPLGIMPLNIWMSKNPNPSLEDLLDRHLSVLEAVVRFRRAGVEPKREWLDELFGEFRGGKLTKLNWK